jgi:hypothetical protein
MGVSVRLRIKVLVGPTNIIDFNNYILKMPGAFYDLNIFILLKRRSHGSTPTN